MNQITPTLILEQMLEALDKVEIDKANELPATIRCAEISHQAVRQLESYLLDHSFEDKAEEIHFFKTLKPQIEGRLMYYLKLTSLLQLAPVADSAQRSAHQKSHLVAIEQFFRDHAELHLYYRMEYTYLDQYYFTRQSEGTDLVLDDAMVVMDRRFNTRKSHHFSLFFAQSLLASHLNMLLDEDNGYKRRAKEPTLMWTGTQAQIIELLYAINDAGFLNHKKQDIKTVTDYFGHFLGIKITNPYGTHDNNRMRKKNRFACLDHLRKVLNATYEYDDEHAL